ncbi:MAG: 23S rRNA (guanosine(2251)-2'-O)-methyltransferase RlmB [Alphaproteobacteria bacterium]|nr:23S rRNA (guanosine(2251)-2'-O)-methyltransferase RlmB [Alphaproteobacteria bacterium]
MKKDPRGKPSSPQRPSFGKGKPAFGDKPRGKRPDSRKSTGTSTDSFDKRPRRTDRSEEGGARIEGFGKAPSRFAKKSAFGRSTPTTAEGRSYGRRDEPRKPAGAGGFDKRPRRTDRSEESSSRTQRPERTERFAKPSSRFEGKPAYGSRKPRSESGSFRKKPEGRTAPIADKAKFRPKRESLQRQGVLLWGLHAVREAWLNPARKCYRLWATESGLEALEEALLDGKNKGLARPEPLLSQKSDIEHFLPHSTVHQGVVLEVEPLAELTLDDLLGQDEGPELVVILDQVTDPHNVGAILRSAAAFGANAVIVTERNAPGATGTLAKTACGALEHVPLITVVNVARTIEALQEESFWCVGLAEEGDHDLAACKLGSGRIALIMGAEGEGLRRLTREHCDELARLPTGDAIGSLNVSNAAAISLYEAVRQKKE